MRRILAATVLASPFILSAAAIAAPPVTDATASTPARPLSTGVKPAHVLSSRDVDLRPAAFQTLPVGAEVVLSLNVDEKGHAQGIQVLNSSNHELDGPVAESVSHYRFRPATLDHQPVTTPMTLTVLVQR
ncbi:MAG TPA: energy transducer TonB [Terracidiphilus sp.]